MDILGLHKWIPNLKHPLIIAGPCSAETEEQVLATAHALKQDERIKIFRAGIWKPRTRPNSFEGVGEAGLPWLKRVKFETGMMTATEVANANHAELALKYGVDILWIGARTTASPFAVQEIADAIKGVNIPVMIKNPINEDLALWIGAIERILGSGTKMVAAIHRGFSTYEKNQYRNPPRWQIPIELKRRFPHLPIITDPSHIAGRRDLVAGICQKAMDVDFDGLMIETHMTPDQAWSDAAQQVTPEGLFKIIDALECRTEFSTDRDFEETLEALRAQIDRTDRELLEQLQTRMQIVEQIGLAKLKQKVTVLQVSRLDELLRDRMEQGKRLGLSAEYVRDLFNAIHAESVRKQTDILHPEAESAEENHANLQ